MKDVLPVQEGEKTQNYEEQVEALTLKSPFTHTHPQQEQSPHTSHTHKQTNKQQERSPKWWLFFFLLLIN